MLVFVGVWSYMKFQQTLVCWMDKHQGFFLKKKHWIVWFGWQIFILLGWKNHLMATLVRRCWWFTIPGMFSWLEIHPSEGLKPQYFRSEFHKRTLGMVFFGGVFLDPHLADTHFLLNQAKCSPFLVVKKPRVFNWIPEISREEKKQQDYNAYMGESLVLGSGKKKILIFAESQKTLILGELRSQGWFVFSY